MSLLSVSVLYARGGVCSFFSLLVGVDGTEVLPLFSFRSLTILEPYFMTSS